MLFRLILILLGIFVGLHGHTEYLLQEKSSEHPIPIELMDLEAGRELSSIHLELGHHWKLFEESIYSYQIEKNEDPDSPSLRVNYAYYPLISEAHPYSQAFNRLAANYGSMDEVPESEIPVLEDFAILVRTTQYKTVGAIPINGGWQEADQLVGMVVNDLREIKDDEKDLLYSSYPRLDLSRVLIVEEGRKPESALICILWMVGGIA